MQKITKVSIHAECQKGKTLDAVALPGAAQSGRMEYVFEWGEHEARGMLTVQQTPDSLAAYLQLALPRPGADEGYDLAMEHPITLELQLSETPQKITAMYLFNDWWTRPAFIEHFGQIPPRTQLLYLQYPDRCACLVPAVGQSFKASLGPCEGPGKADTLRFTLSAWQGGQSGLDEPAFLLTQDTTILGAVQKAFRRLAAQKGLRTRQERRLPEMFRYLGWCSWDAFYTDISEEKVRAKAEELRTKNLPVRWMLMDDGWLAVQDGKLYDFAPEKEKFPNGFAAMLREIRQDTNVKWFGVWHALGGYWGGVLPGSPLAERQRAHLFETISGRLLPHPQKEKGFGFYNDWYEYLMGEGIDFAKVDGQSAVKNYYENCIPISRAARGIHRALEGGAAYLDGAVINCMGMAMENILARPATALSRSSDDFVPSRKGGFAEHLLQNAYNALYQGQLYHCDWDMFWTSHEEAAKHSLLRAVSGGPVYFSDKIGETDPAVLAPLALLDGRLLLMDRPAYPAESCVFADPMKDGVLKLTNTVACAGKTAGGIAVYNLTGSSQQYSFSPAEVPELEPAGQYLVRDYFTGSVRLCGGDENIQAGLPPEGFGWYQILPFAGEAAFLGLIEKYVGFAALEEQFAAKDSLLGILSEQGPAGFVSARAPQKVLCNGEDITALLREEPPCGSLHVYTLALPPRSGRAVLEVRFS